MKKSFPWRSVLVTILIVIAVIIPGSSIPELTGNWFGIDKIIHFAMFLFWALAIQADFKIVTTKREPLAFLCCVGFSLITEVLQLFVETRSFDFFDMVFDCIGFLVGLLPQKYINSKKMVTES